MLRHLWQGGIESLLLGHLSWKQPLFLTITSCKWAHLGESFQIVPDYHNVMRPNRWEVRCTHKENVHPLECGSSPELCEKWFSRWGTHARWGINYRGSYPSPCSHFPAHKLRPGVPYGSLGPVPGPKSNLSSPSPAFVPRLITSVSPTELQTPQGPSLLSPCLLRYSQQRGEN